MRQNEVPDRIRTLNGKPVVVPGLEKPRVLCYEQPSRRLVRPELTTAQHRLDNT